MKCQNCLREIATWHTYCPHCQTRVSPPTYSIITHDPTETLEQNSRRKLLRNTVHFTLFGIALIALAGVIRLNQPSASAPAKEIPGSQPENSAAAKLNPVTPDSVVTLPSPAPAPVGNENIEPKNSQPIALFSAEVVAKAMNKPAPVVTIPRIKNEPPPQKIAVNSSLNEGAPVDEAPPRKLAALIKSPVATDIINPAVTAKKEPEPNLELESSSANLNAKIGLLTIKSYVPARVYIDGTFSGVTPRSIKLLTGDHAITLMANGYHEYSRVVKVNGQQQIGILAAMNKK